MNNKSKLIDKMASLLEFSIENSNASFQEKYDLYKSYEILNGTKKVNVILTIIVILFGLLGNSLIVYVFSKKRFRVNSSNVFILCLAVNDSCFFIVHFFEVKNFLFVINYAFFQPSKSYFKKIYSNFSKTMLNG